MKKITQDEYLKLLGLFTLASDSQRQCYQAETLMNKMLGLDNGSHLSDEIYGPGRGFDEALKREGFEVEQ